MAIRGRKIKFIDSDMIHRFGLTIIADPNMAQIYVNKGLAIFADQPPVPSTIQIISDKVKHTVATVEAFFRETIFPSSIIPS